MKQRITPYPKMNTSEGQATVNTACDEVQRVILNEMAIEEQQKLTQEQDLYKTFKSPPKQMEKTKKQVQRKTSVTQLQKELTQLQANVAHLSSLMDTNKKDSDKNI